MYFIIQGRVQISQRDESGGQQNIAVHGVGEFFGETSMLGDSVRIATVTASGPLILLRMRERDMMKLIENDDEVAFQLHKAFEMRKC